MTEDLSDESVLLSLQELIEDLGSTETYMPHSGDEAYALVETLLTRGGRPPARPGDGGQWAPAARRLLAHLSADDDTAPRMRAILADPPTSDRLGAEIAATDLVVLAAIVTWLQTKIDVKVKHKDGGWEFDFQLTKKPVPVSVLRRLAGTVSRVLGGPTDPDD
ncbi:hypothetical protein OG417_51620 [Actinoallomurus sp. NBC_01490]|uniref:hypothetical protein n=1 Tax=Actinoallomurus sp. NBC_01490 TaxID=2903557 RepID=UPI002E369E02|nr:hypothetical protein [Actinoallomurus sp. NBC_01490]